MTRAGGRAMLAVLLWGWTLTPPAEGVASQAAPAPISQRTLVVPFDNVANDAPGAWLGVATAIALTDDLEALGVPVIGRDDRLRAFDRLHVPPVATLSHATIIRVGEVVGAASVVIGTFEVAGTQLVVHARFIRLAAGRILPDIVERGPVADLFGISARVARRLVGEATIPEADLLRGDPAPAAFEQYVKGLFAEAPAARIAFLTRALRIAPAFERIRLALWGAHTEVGDHLKALTSVRDVPAGHRFGRQARFRAAISLLSLGRNQEAFDTLTALNEAQSDSALVNNMGVAQMRRAVKDPKRPPADWFSEAARLDPADPDLVFNRGYAAWMAGDAQAAITWLRETVRRNPADDAAHYVLAVALDAQGAVAEAAREKDLARRLSSAVDEWENRPGVRGVPRGLERVKTDLDVPATLRVDAIIVAAGQRDQRALARHHIEAGRRLSAAGRDEDATAELRRAVYLSPYDAEAHHLLGQLYLRSGRTAEAIDALTIAVWSDDTIAARLTLARAFEAAGDAAGMRREVLTILEREPDNVEAQRLLGR